MAESEARSAIVLELAEEFLERYRCGERPPLREYIDRHPELATEIKEVFPAMAMMEHIALPDESLDDAGQNSGARIRTTPALQQLGDYRIIREIGQGGMGLVYEAEQVSLGRHVALKVLPDKALLDPKHKRRFEREARAAAKLHHTNIVPVFGVGEHDGLPYYVMQFIQGLGLDVVLEELRHMKPDAAHTPSCLPTVGEIRVVRRDLSAAEVARSLVTGEFQPAANYGSALAANPRPALGATMAQPAKEREKVERPEARGEVAVAVGASSPSAATNRLADALAASSSSITLGRSAGSGSAAQKPNYWQSVAHIGRQVADALAYAHKQGVLHRDIKPSNLLLDLRGTVWVTDFGLAKVSGPGAEGDNLTHTGDIVGTLRYLPPEAFEGHNDARGDIYALGLTLYEMLTLRPAYQEKDRHKLIRQVTTSEPALLDTVNPKIPRDLVTIVHKAIDREPSRRYGTAEDLVADLQRFVDDEPILARRQTQLERCWRWARHHAGIAVLGGVLTAVLLLATAASLIVAGRMSTLAVQAGQNEARALQNEQEATQNAQRAEQAGKETAKALATVAAQKAEVEDSLSGSLEYFSAALRQADSYAARKPIVVLAARFDMVLSALVERQPEDRQLQLALARKLTERGRKHLVQKQPAKAQEALEKSRAIYTRLLTATDSWKVLTPVAMEADTGAKPQLQQDGSILVPKGPSSRIDTYRLVFQTELEGIRGLRLEVLANPRLPADGPGWVRGGRYVCNELAVQAASAKGPDTARAIPLRNASTDWSWNAITGEDWGVAWLDVNQDVTAVFDLGEEVGDGQATRLTVQLRHSNADNTLGRFRLSFTTDAKTLQARRVRQELKDSEVVDCHITLGKLYAQQDQTNEAVASFAQALPLTGDRAGKARIIAAAALLQGALEKLVERAAGDGQFQAELARHFAASGNAPVAAAAHAKARALLEAKLAKEPENSALAAELAQLLWDKHDGGDPAPWTVLQPAEVTSKGGATLTMLDDDSILAGGVNPPSDQYTVDFIVPQRMEIRSVRLEALTHDTLPGRGPGRSRYVSYNDHGRVVGGSAGLFELTRWDLTATGADGADWRHPLSFRAASADYSMFDQPLGLRGEWNTSWAGGNDHTSVWALLDPVTLAAGTKLRSQMRFNPNRGWTDQNLGRFRLSVSSDPAAFEREQKRFTAMRMIDPAWAKLVAAYHVLGDQPTLDGLLKHHPAAAVGIGDWYAAAGDWERAIAEYRKLITDQSSDDDLVSKLAEAYQRAGRVREAVPYLARASAAVPNDTVLSLKVAALQAWFGQDKEFAATRQRILAFAKDNHEAYIRERAAKACSILPSTDKAELEAALTLGRTAVKLGYGDGRWNLVSLGMAEYRSGNNAAAERALLAAAKAGAHNPLLTGTSAFYRAMSQFRQGNKDEARKLAIAAAAKMRPLPADAQNPLTGDACHDDLIVWLAYKEAKALIGFEAAPAANELMRALAQHRRGEADQAKKACRKAAEMLQLAGGAALDLPLLRQMVLALGTESPESRELIAAAAGEPPATLNDAVTHNPDQAQGYRDRGNWYAERARWKDAIADFLEVFRLDPNAFDAMKLGILLAQNGEKDRFHEHGLAVLSRWGSTEKNYEADRALKTIILLPGYLGDAKQLARLAEVAVAGDESQPNSAWGLLAKGLHGYRTGKYMDALATSRASRQRAGATNYGPEVLRCLDLVVEALALQGAGNADEARRTLEQAKPLIQSHVLGVDGGDWADWLSAHILYREAAALLAAQKAEPNK